MRKLALCFCLLTLALAPPSLTAQETTLSLPQERMKLITAFDLIEKQSGYAIAYNEDLININRYVVPSTGKPLQATFESLLKGTGMEAHIQDRMVFIVPKMDSENDWNKNIYAPPFNIIEESVIVGYGRMNKKDITSAVSIFHPGTITSTASSDICTMLQGNIAGVNIQASSGSVGSRNRVSIRGIGSLTAGNEPLYVVDGIPISNTTSDAGGWEGEETDALSDINPDDIESIQILKDAAASAIYGSRGTNGVVLITTKKGKKGTPKVSIDAGCSLSYIPNLRKLKVADADLYLEVQNEAIDNYNAQTGQSVPHINNPYPERGYFSWTDLVLRTSVSWKANASISGGSEKSRYYISANVRHNQGVIIGSKAEKYGIRANVETDIKRWLSAGVNIGANYNYTHHVPNGNMGTSMLTHSLEHRPWDRPYKEDGSYTTKDNELLHYNLLQALYEQDAFNRNYRLIGNIFAQINFIENLSLRSSVGGDFIYTEDYVYYNSKHMYGNSVGKLIDARNAHSSLVVDNVLSYHKKFNSGLKFDAMVGHSFQTDASSTASQTGQGFPSKDFNVNSAAAEYLNVTSGRKEWAMQSFITRITLNHLDRYLLTLSARTDGSSKFATKNRYGFFPSASAGWVISKEPFWKDPKTTIKLRMSVGMTGNQGGIGAYAWMPLANGGYNYLNESGIAFMTKGNENLKWEKTTQYDMGLDMAFFSGQLTLSADFFQKYTKDMLYNKPIPATSGFTNEICNIGQMRNSGLELTLGSDISIGDFRWQGGFNISFIKNRLTSLINDGVLTSGSYHALKVGEEVGSFYMIKMLGIYQSDDQVPTKQYAQGVRAGDIMYEDVNGDGDIDTVNDSQFVGSANPLFTGGLSSTFYWKGFDLSFLLTFSYGNMIYQTWTGGLRLGYGLWPSQESEALARWTGPGTSNTVPRAIYGMTWNSTKFVNTRFLHDGSYLRCRNLSLGYTLPSYALRKIGIRSLRVHFSADNLFLISPYRYIDPEVTSSLDATKMGTDNMWLPQPRTFSFGLNVKF